MNVEALKSKTCIVCGKEFRYGVDRKSLNNYCDTCHVKGWQKEMHDLGCSVTHHKNIGKMAKVTKVRLRDCPKIIINGVTYRDTTKLLYEDTRYKTSYPSKEQWARIRKVEGREMSKIISELTKEDPGEEDGFINWTAKEDDLLKRMRADGCTYKYIAYMLKRPVGTVCGRIRKKRAEGILIE